MLTPALTGLALRVLPTGKLGGPRPAPKGTSATTLVFFRDTHHSGMLRVLEYVWFVKVICFSAAPPQVLKTQQVVREH